MHEAVTRPKAMHLDLGHDHVHMLAVFTYNVQQCLDLYTMLTKYLPKDKMPLLRHASPGHASVQSVL